MNERRKGPYPEEFKRGMVSKMVGPEKRSATSLSKEVDIPQATLSNWLREYAPDNGKDKARRPRDWSAEEKLRALTETASLKEAELGEYLRRHGCLAFFLSDIFSTESKHHAPLHHGSFDAVFPAPV